MQCGCSWSLKMSMEATLDIPTTQRIGIGLELGLDIPTQRIGLGLELARAGYTYTQRIGLGLPRCRIVAMHAHEECGGSCMVHVNVHGSYVAS